MAKRQRRFVDHHGVSNTLELDDRADLVFVPLKPPFNVENRVVSRARDDGFLAVVRG